MVLTESQISEFHSHGCLFIKGVLKDRELALLQETAERVYLDGLAGRGDYHEYTRVARQDVYLRSRRLWRTNDIFSAVTANPVLLTIVAQCIGYPFLPIDNAMVCKPVGRSATIDWHQDPPYDDLRTVNTFPVPNFDVGIYIDDADIESGCLWVWPGYHLVGHINLSYPQEDLYSHDAATPILAEAGDVFLHAHSIPHASLSNGSGRPRRVLYLHYVARAVLENCYAFVDQTKVLGFEPSGFERMRAMFESRRQMGLSSDDRVALADDGIWVAGVATARTGYWAGLSDNLTAEQRRAMQMLRAPAD